MQIMIFAGEMAHFRHSFTLEIEGKDFYDRYLEYFMTPYFIFVCDTFSYLALLGLHLFMCLGPSTTTFSGVEWAIKGRENECKRVMIGFGFTSDRMKNWRGFLSQSRRVVSAKPINFRHSNENLSSGCSENDDLRIKTKRHCEL